MSHPAAPAAAAAAIRALLPPHACIVGTTGTGVMGPLWAQGAATLAESDGQGALSVLLGRLPRCRVSGAPTLRHRPAVPASLSQANLLIRGVRGGYVAGNQNLPLHLV